LSTYKLLIVDDEEFIRSSISDSIDWNTLGFSNVEQAENGEQALDITERCKPDLVITDIKMPFMSGLELTEKLKKRDPEIMVAIMTGYDDFKFAQKGIDLGVVSYILKPVGIASLTKIIGELKRSLDKNAREKKHLEKTRQQLMRSLPLLKEHFYKRFVCNPYQTGDLQKYANLLDLPDLCGPFIACVLEPDFSGLSIDDIELYNYAIKNIASDTIGNDKPIFCSDDSKIGMVFVLPAREEQRYWRQNIAETLKIIKLHVNEIFKISLTAGIGTTVDDFCDLHCSYSKALSVLDCRYTLGKNKIYDVNDMDYQKTGFCYPAEDCSKFVEAVKIADENAMTLYMGNIKRFLSDHKEVATANIKMVFVEVVTNLLKLLTEIKGISRETWSDGFMLFETIQRSGTVEEISGTIMRFAHKISAELYATRSSSNKKLIGRVTAYLLENYADETLSLATAASFAAVSSGYLSAIFKKETGRHFIDYLTEVRMEKAKQLLRTTDMRAYEISFKTGFSNSNYFSYAFKKYTGISPSDFKNLPFD
jgi:Response regulator containing CheY-like receiver domain and AraC-type DNA-binding domain